MKQRKKPMTALTDASSAIILYKANLHHIVCEMYSVVIPTSVYKEITGNSLPGAEAYQQLEVTGKITLQAPRNSTLQKPSVSDVPTLDKGERDVIQLYYAGNGDLVPYSRKTVINNKKSENSIEIINLK